MTKIYKELQEAFKSIEDKNNGVPGNMPIVATGTPMIDIYRIANSLLLEALSDKEEGLIIGDFVKKDNKGKWVNCFGYEKEGVVVGTDPLKVVEEPKQEECLHLKQKILHKLDGSTEETCRDCGKDIGGSKQSTSLKEAAISLLTGYKTDDRNRFEVADQILKLIQSHLVKETETLEPSKYVQMDSECLEGYNICKESIIKIINNIN